MKTVTLTFRITINANQQKTFEYVSDWEKQSDWIMFTTVKELSKSTTNQDINLLAITKFWPIKLVDTMVITELKPFERIVVEHTGRVVLGKGVFSVRKLSSGSCEFMWQEITPVPFGFIGRVGLVILGPIIRLPFLYSLRKLKANIEATK
jgi:hypothetical protein